MDIEPRGGTKVLGLMGLGFWQAWWMVAMCTDVLLPDPAQSPFPISLSVLLLSLSCLGYLAVVIVWRIGLHGKDDRGEGSPRLVLLVAVACSVVGSLGMGLVAHSDVLALFGGSLFMVAVAAFSLGNAMLLVTWGSLWSTLAIGYVGRLLCVSYTAAFILFFAVRALPLPLAIAICALLPVASAAGLIFATKAPRRTALARPADRASFPYGRALAAVVVANFVWGVTQKYLYVADGDIASLAFMFGGACLLAFTAYLFIASPTEEPRVLYRPVIPALVCGIALIVAFSPDDAFLGEGVMIYGGYCLDMLIMLVASDVAFRTRRPIVMLFGIALFVARLGSLFGTVVGEWCANVNAPQVVVAMLCVIALTLVGTVLFSQAELDRFYQVQAGPKAEASYEKICEEISATCGLTTRESEVLGLLARGRSAPFIGQELNIAVGTVKNHVSSIYRKLGVCDRQSLHNIIEREELL